MKNSKEYSEKLRKFRRSPKKAAKTRKVGYEDPIDGLVFGIVSECLSEAEAEAAMKRFSDYFINLNDLRVSRVEEIVDVAGKDTPQTRQMAATLIKVLRAVFDKYHSISLKGLKKLGKKPARQAIEKLNGITPFAIDCCMLTSMQAHAVPVTGKMMEYLKSNDLVHPEAGEEEIRGFLAKHIPAQQAFEFYQCLKAESEGAPAKTHSSSKIENQTAQEEAGGSRTVAKKTTKKPTADGA
jgi:endonuclease III